MITEEDLNTAKQFLDIVNREALAFGQSLEIDLQPELITVTCSSGYTSTLVMSGEQAIVENKEKQFIEKDFDDGLVRTRHELIRHLNPRAFEYFNM